jgi:hypothetical protein
MRKCFVIAAAAFVSCLSASSASAQSSWSSWSPLDGRLIFSLNAAGQTGSQDLTRTNTFSLYEEQATEEFSQKVEAGPFLDIGAAYKIGQDFGLGPDRFGIGMVYTSLKSSENGSVTGSYPHPDFFERPRSITATADNLEHKEQAVHIQAILFIPFVEKVDFALSVGPSFFTTSQDFIRSVQISENPPAFNSVNVDSVDVVNVKESSVGFNLGMDVTYSFTPTIGAGAMLRFTHSSQDFTVAEGQSTSLDVGGFQIGAGVRLRF